MKGIMKDGKKWVYSKAEMIDYCLGKIAAIPNDETLFSQSLKVDLIKQWMEEISRINNRSDEVGE